MTRAFGSSLAASTTGVAVKPSFISSNRSRSESIERPANFSLKATAFSSGKADCSTMRSIYNALISLVNPSTCSNKLAFASRKAIVSGCSPIDSAVKKIVASSLSSS